MLLGVDTGGTFTDFVILDGKRLRFHKELSTPHDPCVSILRGLRALDLAPARLRLVHGSTVATNAILERKGVKTLFVTNRGLEDVLLIGRQTREQLYALCPPAPQKRIDPEDCFGLSGRVDVDGNLVQGIDPADLERLAKKAEGYASVAICTLFSFLDPAQETAAAGVLPGHVFIAQSHEVLNEYREYERAAATFLNAYVGPLVQRYLMHLAGTISPRHLYVMHSAGGVMDAAEAGKNAVRMVLSGPAGGLVAARRAGEQLSMQRLITFDMGGTSTDVSLLSGGAFHITTEARIADFPVAVPMLDIHTIGAGGGSIAWRDAAGLLQVGPESAGADPGPACYGRGGTLATVTDANVVLGRIPATARLAGSMPIDAEKSRRALAGPGKAFAMDAVEMARGIVRVAEENMAGALRVVSVQRGHDPGKFALVCFGGAGGLHACALAEALEIPRIILPVASGAFSAMGMLAGRRQCDLSQSRRLDTRDGRVAAEAGDIFVRLETQARRRMPDADLTFNRFADMRYQGQGFHLTIPCAGGMDELEARFVRAHAEAYGHTLDRSVEIMTLRVTAVAQGRPLRLPELPSAISPPDCSGHSEVYDAGRTPHYRREGLRPGHHIDGPALVLEDTATLWLPPSWQFDVTPYGHLLLTRRAPA